MHTISFDRLTKRYGPVLAVDGLSFDVGPGRVTGFPGPNRAGKSTTMRMTADLDEPTTGRVRVNGRDYRAAPAPLAELDILLEAKAMHTGRPARNHLLALAQTKSRSSPCRTSPNRCWGSSPTSAPRSSTTALAA
jgi:ABC-2 type transport system ATP-binding protein